ncbi:MAG: hypothetical protein J7578_01830 [Chitinophagaceae bacterium]|nr:hypothetical protein [Chitinophagaceae bacterium]
MKMNRACVLHVTSLMICCFAALAAIAQPDRKLFEGKGSYLSMPRNLKSYVAINCGFTPAQIKTFNDNMSAFMEIMGKTPCIHPPRGYEVGTYGGICGDGACDGSKIMAGTGGYIIREWTTTNSNPVPERAEEGPSINVSFNDIRPLIQRRSADKTGYSEPNIVNTIAGCPVFENGYVVITKIKKPLFKYVTNETVLRGKIKDEEEAIRNARETFAKGSAYQQWLANKESTLKAVKEGMDILAQTNPAEAKAKWEKAKDGYDKMEQELKSREAKELEENRKYLSAFEKRLVEYKNQLAAMSPTEKNAHFVYNGRKVVIPNPEFFDTTRKPTDLQLVIIDLFRYDLDNRLTHQLIGKIRKEVDFAALVAGIK